ncbi:MAG: BlaI/MecI/CopY family transcriptional regulator [Phycisphaerae bacterium]
MRKRQPEITAAELRVLKALWKLENATVRDVKELLDAEGGKSSAYTTVMTLLNQLAAKDVLAVDRARQPFVYSPKVRREEVLGHRLRQFLQSVFDGQGGELVLRLIDEVQLSPEEIRRLEAKIDALDPSLPGSADEQTEDGK